MVNPFRLWSLEKRFVFTFVFNNCEADVQERIVFDDDGIGAGIELHAHPFPLLGRSEDISEGRIGYRQIRIGSGVSEVLPVIPIEYDVIKRILRVIGIHPDGLPGCPKRARRKR